MARAAAAPTKKPPMSPPTWPPSDTDRTVKLITRFMARIGPIGVWNNPTPWGQRQGGIGAQESEDCPRCPGYQRVGRFDQSSERSADQRRQVHRGERDLPQGSLKRQPQDVERETCSRQGGRRRGARNRRVNTRHHSPKYSMFPAQSGRTVNEPVSTAPATQAVAHRHPHNEHRHVGGDQHVADVPGVGSLRDHAQ